MMLFVAFKSELVFLTTSPWRHAAAGYMIYFPGARGLGINGVLSSRHVTFFS